MFHKKYGRHKPSDVDIEELKLNYSRNFVRQNTEQIINTVPAKSSHLSSLNLNGNEVKTFYESIINDQNLKKDISKHDKVSTEKRKGCSSRHSKELTKKSFKTKIYLKDTKKKLFQFVNNGDLNNVKLIIKNISNSKHFVDIINSNDTFGWNLIMCASAEGYIEIIKYLCEIGCKYELNKIIEICNKRKQYTVIDYFNELESEYQNEKVVKTKTQALQKVTCQLCQVEFDKEKQKQHETSTIHIFNNEHKPKNCYGIPQHNKGHQMLLRSGWTHDSGLGPMGDGRKNPVGTYLKQNRKGLGMESTKKRVTHFQSFDEEAVRHKKKEHLCSIKKQVSMKTILKNKNKEKQWEKNLRFYMSMD